MRIVGRFLFIMAFGGTVAISVSAAGKSPIGVVEVSQNANLDGQNAVVGSDFYGGEEFVTYQEGQVRLRVHHCRIDLGEMTNARFLPDASPDRLLVIQGSARYSCPIGAALLIETPAGVLHGADGKAASGMVEVTDAHDLMISAYDAPLVLDNDGELHYIQAGQTYRVAVTDEADNGVASPQAVSHHRRKLLLWRVMGIGSVAVADYFLWNCLTESPWKPNVCHRRGPRDALGTVYARRRHENDRLPVGWRRVQASDRDGEATVHFYG